MLGKHLKTHSLSVKPANSRAKLTGFSLTKVIATPDFEFRFNSSHGVNP